MFNHRSITYAAVLGAAMAAPSLPVYGQSGVTADGWRDVGGEAGWVYVGTPPSGKTRAQVSRELAEWNRNPVTADGYRSIGGEAGWLYVGVPGSATTRAQVKQELAEWNRNAVTADGYKWIGGEAGWVYVGDTTSRPTSAAEAHPPAPRSAVGRMPGTRNRGNPGR